MSTGVFIMSLESMFDRHSDPNIVFLVVQGVRVSWFNDAMVSMERSPRDAIKDELVRPPFMRGVIANAAYDFKIRFRSSRFKTKKEMKCCKPK